MNIAMFTNTYAPVMGGVSRSIATFTEDLRDMGHAVLVVTLQFAGAEDSDDQVFRLPAVTEVGGTDFSLRLPAPTGLRERIDAFAPDVIHSQHPFMLGDTALRVARKRDLPLLFTHHTLYEHYAYLFSRESEALEQIAMAMATEYANLCDQVIAPTESIEGMIRDRGVEADVVVIPTGIDIDLYANGRRKKFRQEHKVPVDAFVLGYLGRVVEAKNMEFLADVAAGFLQAHPQAWFLVVGDGEASAQVQHRTKAAGVADRVRMTGSLSGRAVADAYAAMDVFAFASKTETQGIVLAESLCAGVPVVGLDACGTRDMLRPDCGILLDEDASSAQFVKALCRLKDDPERLSRLRSGASARAADFDRRLCAKRLLATYTALTEHGVPRGAADADPWAVIQDRFAAEWDLLKEKLSVMVTAVASGNTSPDAKESRIAE